MTTPLIPQEIYLLERYSSPEYFGQLRDAWVKMLDAAEQAMDSFMRQLPADYRNRALPDQPDIGWGERVLPNFRSTRETLDIGYMDLASGDWNAIGLGGNVRSAINGQTINYDATWMASELYEEFFKWQRIAFIPAFNLEITSYAGWTIGDLSNDYNADSRGPLNPPESWPIYQLNHKVRFKTDDVVPQNGIYLPDCEDSCAALMGKDFEAFEASVGYDPKTMQNIASVPTTWTLVERIADRGGGIPGDANPVRAGMRIRVLGGQPCPQSGYYFTPAQSNSRRQFKQGDSMPNLGGDYGVTIWQWDINQSVPEL